MKKFLIAFMLFFAAFANAKDYLNVNSQCNDGMSSTTVNQLGMSPTSCSLIATKIAPGLDLHLQGEGLSMFFFDSFVYVTLNNVDIPIRFVVFEDEKDYNAIQAIAQTAYATRTPVSVIFQNPMRAGGLYDLATFNTKRTTEKTCYKSVVNGSIVSINCPIQSIQLNLN